MGWETCDVSFNLVNQTIHLSISSHLILFSFWKLTFMLDTFFFLKFQFRKKKCTIWCMLLFEICTPHTLNKFILKWFSINTYYTLTMVTKMEIGNLEFGVCYMVEMLPLGGNIIREKSLDFIPKFYNMYVTRSTIMSPKKNICPITTI